MKRMWSRKELKNQAINDVKNAIDENEIMVVSKISAPASTTLTQELIDLITDGTFIEGDFLGLKNALFCPATLNEGTYRGIVISLRSNTVPAIMAYYINNSTKEIGLYTADARAIAYDSIGQISGKNFPQFPASTGSFTLKYVNGALTWVED